MGVRHRRPDNPNVLFLSKLDNLLIIVFLISSITYFIYLICLKRLYNHFEISELEVLLLELLIQSLLAFSRPRFHFLKCSNHT